jgi:hypothetical protein
MTKTMEEIEGMHIPRGTLIEIVIGDEVRPVYFAGVDKSSILYFERVVNNLDDIKSKPYYDALLLRNIDNIVLHTGWGKVK